MCLDNRLIAAFTCSDERARKTGLSKFAIWMRLNRLNWDVERAMTAPLRRQRRRVKVAQG